MLYSYLDVLLVIILWITDFLKPFTLETMRFLKLRQ